MEANQDPEVSSEDPYAGDCNTAPHPSTWPDLRRSTPQPPRTFKAGLTCTPPRRYRFPVQHHRGDWVSPRRSSQTLRPGRCERRPSVPSNGATARRRRRAEHSCVELAPLRSGKRTPGEPCSWWTVPLDLRF